MTSTSSGGPLAGLRVLELAGIGPAPYAFSRAPGLSPGELHAAESPTPTHRLMETRQ